MTDVLDKGGKGLTDVLKKKLGPLPVAVWVGVGGAAGYYIYRTRKASNAGTGTGDTGDGSGTVPATGSGSYSPVGPGSSSNPGSGTTDTPTRFADNQAWASAAISYLVGLGYEGTQVNQAIQTYLASLPMTSAQQGMVNLAILKIGATPELVAPAQQNPPPVVTPPSGGGGSSAPASVTNLQAHVHSANSISLSWTASAGATKYEATITNSGGSATITTRSTSARWDDLLPGFDSVFSVVAINSNGRSAATTVSASTPSDGGGGGGGSDGGGGGGGIYGTWAVEPGDNLWDISKAVLASRGLSTTNAAILDYDKRLYAANSGVIGGNPNLIKPGQVLTLP